MQASRKKMLGFLALSKDGIRKEKPSSFIKTKTSNSKLEPKEKTK